MRPVAPHGSTWLPAEQRPPKRHCSCRSQDGQWASSRTCGSGAESVAGGLRPVAEDFDSRLSLHFRHWLRTPSSKTRRQAWYSFHTTRLLWAWVCVAAVAEPRDPPQHLRRPGTRHERTRVHENGLTPGSCKNGHVRCIYACVCACVCYVYLYMHVYKMNMHM